MKQDRERVEPGVCLGVKDSSSEPQSPFIVLFFTTRFSHCPKLKVQCGGMAGTKHHQLFVCLFHPWCYCTHTRVRFIMHYLPVCPPSRERERERVLNMCPNSSFCPVSAEVNFKLCWKLELPSLSLYLSVSLSICLSVPITPLYIAF